MLLTSSTALLLLSLYTTILLSFFLENIWLPWVSLLPKDVLFGQVRAQRVPVTYNCREYVPATYNCREHVPASYSAVENTFPLVITVGNRFSLVITVENTFPSLITLENMFPLVITVRNRFPLAITVENTFLPLITVGNTFPLLITVGKNVAHLFLKKNVTHVKCHLWATVYVSKGRLALLMKEIFQQKFKKQEQNNLNMW